MILTHKSEIVAGQLRGWSLIEKLGEGDAGEVYRVEALIDRQPAILKRPRRGAFPSDLIRQATQIEKEGRVLAAQARLESSARLVCVPRLLDQSQAGTEFSERYFIITSLAAGFDLTRLARLVHAGRLSPEAAPGLNLEHCSPVERSFLERMAEVGKLPDLLVLRTLAGLIDYLEAIHVLLVDTPTAHAAGILWNDVKPDHLYWDPQQARLTLIDWGNAQFLESDGVTRDRQHSRMSDYQQLLAEMGRFLAASTPELYERLEWPTGLSAASLYSHGILPLKERLTGLLQSESEVLALARQQEAELVNSAELAPDQLPELARIHQQIVQQGEVPDQEGARAYFIRLAQSLILAGNLQDLRQLCAIGRSSRALPPQHCRLLERLSEVAQQGQLSSQALLAALAGDWPAAMWELRQAARAYPEPLWWDDLSSQLRSMENRDEPLRPLTALNRMIHALQATAQQVMSAPGPGTAAAQQNSTNLQNGSAPNGNGGASGDRSAYDALLQPLKDEVLPRWIQLEPDPPDSGIEYREIERYLDSARELMTNAAIALDGALVQSRAQVALAIDAWARQDFSTARRALQLALFWDPERRRYLQADRAVQRAPDWLAELRRGLGHDDTLQDVITRLELSGRELRNQVGSAPWLDALLEALRQLRRGADPAEVLVQIPQVRDDLGWLLALEHEQPPWVSPNKTLRLERLPAGQAVPPSLFGMKEAPLGETRGLLLGEALDTWAPEARGSSARLFLGQLGTPAGGTTSPARPAAFKLMRPDKTEYALPLVREEARILSLLQDVPGVTPLLECGFIHLEGAAGPAATKASLLPAEERGASAEGLRGEVQRYGLDSIHNFLADLDKQVDRGWIPYLALEKQEQLDNLLLHVDTGHTGGRFLPVLEGLVMAIQICDILDVAHTRSIIYRDHKILHYYWKEPFNSIYTIDWNVAKRYPEGLSPAEIQFDLVQLGARALHYIFAGRSAPGALPMGPNRPEEIEAAAHSYSVQWTYDDRRLPKDVKDLLEAVLTGGFTSARTLREALQATYDKYLPLSRPQA